MWAKNGARERKSGGQDEVEKKPWYSFLFCYRCTVEHGIQGTASSQNLHQYNVDMIERDSASILVRWAMMEREEADFGDVQRAGEGNADVSESSGLKVAVHLVNGAWCCLFCPIYTDTFCNPFTRHGLLDLLSERPAKWT